MRLLKLDHLSDFEARNLDRWLSISPELLDCHQAAYTREELVCPAPADAFRVLQLVAPEEVRVVILGQDPYSTAGKASGIAFGYHRYYNGPIDSSMRNILDELDVLDMVSELPPRRRADFLTLESWVNQGVLLLNTRLTVPIGTPLGHSDIGWQDAVKKLLTHICDSQSVVFLNWGVPAQALCPVPYGSDFRIDTSHPSRYSAGKTAMPFLGSRCFSRANEVLRAYEIPEVRWI